MGDVHFNNFLCEETVVKFPFPHHQHESEDCTQTQDCYFQLKITPGSLENPKDFNIQLMKDSSQPNHSCYRHSDLISAENIHLVAELTDNIVYLSFIGRPTVALRTYVYGEDCLSWGDIFSMPHSDSDSEPGYPDSSVKLVAFVDKCLTIS